MKKAISAVLTLLLISGCVAPPRQLSTSDAVADVSDSVQAEPLQKAPDCTCPKAPECPCAQPKIYLYSGYLTASFLFLALLTAGLIRRYNFAADMYCYWFTHYYEAVAKWKEICSKQLAEIQRLKMIIAQMSED